MICSDQTRQDFEIAGLDNRVDALEGVVGSYQYIIQTANATPRDGQLAFLKGDMSTTTRWGDATNIAVNPTALAEMFGRLTRSSLAMFCAST